MPAIHLAAYVVWVPMRGGEEKHVPHATTKVPDSRASHYWDDQRFLLNAYDAILGIGKPAWDVYLLFGPEEHWGSTPPTPIFWMHQLSPENNPGVDRFPFLDPAVFAEHVETALRSTE